MTTMTTDGTSGFDLSLSEEQQLVQRTAHDFARECRLVPVASLGRGKRAALERIANGVGVMRPNGWWNGQNWVVEVLKRAVEHDLISPEERDNAIYTAAEP